MGRNRNYILACLFMPILMSCHFDDMNIDKLQPIEISPHLALTIGSSSYTVKELLADLEDESLIIQEGDDQSLAIYFSESIIFSDNEKLISIGSITNQEIYTQNTDIPSTPIDYTLPFDLVFTFNFPANGGERIDSVYFSDGLLSYDLTSTFEGDISYTWEIVGTRDVATNENLTQTKSLTYTGGNVSDTYSRSLNGLKAVMYKNVLGENEFQVKVKGEISFDAGAKLSASDQITFDLTYGDPKFSEIYGYFGNEKVEVQNQVIDMSAFADFTGGGLELYNPSIQLSTRNSYGVDLALDFSNVVAVTNDNKTIQLIEKSPPGINALVESPAVVGETKENLISIDRTNSNIDELLNATPVEMQFSVGATPNPNATGADTDFNFLLSDNQIEIVTTVIMPVNLKMDGFSTEFDFEIGGLNVEEAESLVFEIISTNEVPFSGSVDLNFIDIDGNTIYSILNAADIESPDVGTDGRTSEARVSESDVVLDQDGIDAFTNTEKITVVANITTFEADQNRFVKIYSDYQLKFDLAVSGKITVAL